MSKLSSANTKDIIIGKNSVIEALRSHHPIDRILISVSVKKGSIKNILSLARENNIVVKYVDNKKLDTLCSKQAHQGIIAIVASKKYSTIEDMLKLAQERNESPFLVIADSLEDPHNLGAIIRTAECAGVHGVIIPKRNSVGLTSTVSKVSAGAIEHMHIARVTNIVKTIDELKKRGLWIYAADMDGKCLYDAEINNEPIALVVGSEGFGISRLVKENCDFILSLPMKGKITSLNASVAAGILMFEISRQRTITSKVF